MKQPASTIMDKQLKQQTSDPPQIKSSIRGSSFKKLQPPSLLPICGESSFSLQQQQHGPNLDENLFEGETPIKFEEEPILSRGDMDEDRNRDMLPIHLESIGNSVGNLSLNQSRLDTNNKDFMLTDQKDQLPAGGVLDGQKKSKGIGVNECWNKYVCCEKKLIGQFMWFIIISFLVFYALYVTLLPAFTRVYFSQWTFADIEVEYVDQSNQRQLQMSK
jgi:hypothetical protein